MAEKAEIEHNDLVEKAIADAKDEVETVHNDEAVKVLASYDGDLHWTENEEKALVRTIDFRLMPILILTYGLQYYDKAMLSQAVCPSHLPIVVWNLSNPSFQAIFGLIEDLDLTVGTRYSFSASIFYIGFICGAVPAVLLAQRYPIERVATCIVFVWGVVMMSTAGCTNYRGFYAQRFFLGMIESGVSPMFMLIVAGFYKKHEQALRMGVWYSASTL